MHGASTFQSRRQRIQPAIHGGCICAVKASVTKHTKKNMKSMGTDSNEYQKNKISTLRDQRRASKKRSIETVTAAACARMLFCVGRNRSFSSAPRKRGSKRAGVKDPIVTAQRGRTLFRLFFFLIISSEGSDSIWVNICCVLPHCIELRLGRQAISSSPSQPPRPRPDHSRTRRQ